MSRDIASLNILYDLTNHLENAKYSFKSCVSNQAGWSIADFSGKMRMPITSSKTNLNVYTMREMEIILTVFQMDLITALAIRSEEWEELIGKYFF